MAVQTKYRNLAVAARMETGDVTHEAYLKLDNAIDHYNAERQRVFWIYFKTIICYHLIECAKREARLPIEELQEDLVAPVPVGSIDAAEFALIDDITPKGLRDRERKIMVFKQYHFFGWTMQRLADSYGTSTGSIFNWLKEMQKLLKKAYLEQYLSLPSSVAVPGVAVPSVEGRKP